MSTTAWASAGHEPTPAPSPGTWMLKLTNEGPPSRMSFVATAFLGVNGRFLKQYSPVTVWVMFPALTFFAGPTSPVAPTSANPSAVPSAPVAPSPPFAPGAPGGPAGPPRPWAPWAPGDPCAPFAPVAPSGP